MRRPTIRSFLLASLLSTTITGCSSIDRSDDIRRQHLVIGQATKDDVVRSIGLPKRVVTDDASGLEHWLYVGTAAFSGIITGLRTHSPEDDTHGFGKLLVIPSSNGPQSPTFIAAFDKSGHLVDVQYPQRQESSR